MRKIRPIGKHSHDANSLYFVLLPPEYREDKGQWAIVLHCCVCGYESTRYATAEGWRRPPARED